LANNPVLQSDLHAIQTKAEADTTPTQAQRTQLETLLYSASIILFGNSAAPTKNGHSG
jgi:hypothetical protein